MSNGSARRAATPDPYRRLPGIVFRLMREEAPEAVRRVVAETLPQLVPHDALRLSEASPDEIRRALRRDQVERLPRKSATTEDESANPVTLPLVAHGVLIGELEVGRWSGERFDVRERAVLGAFAELVALALHKAHAAAELARLAHTDPLTGLANRRGLTRALERPVLGRSLLLLDLDGLKTVNDELGYDEGDLVICAAADAVRAELRDGELAARLGGDEFVALLSCDAEERGARLNDAVDALPLPRPIRDRFRGGSVGIVEARPEEAPEELLRRAAMHMRERKRSRKSGRPSALG